MKVAVFGAGAVGSYLGSRLTAARADVHLIARGAHLEALRERGLTLITPDGVTTSPVWATDDPTSIGPVDLVLFCVKSYDTEVVARSLAPLVGPTTAVLSIQNGIDNESKIAAVIGPGHVLGAAVYVLASVESPGVVRSGRARVLVGELEPGRPSKRVLEIVELAQSGGLEATAVADVRIAKWEKYTVLVAFSAVSAATQLPVGDIRRAPAAVAMLRGLMTEAWTVGRKLGIPLGDGLVDQQIELLLSQANSAGASLRHDLMTGHRMELEALQGTLSRLGDEAGVPTPWTDAAYAILQPWAIRNERLVGDRTTIPA
jgi:2-dehydropantoate 2-reductase